MKALAMVALVSLFTNVLACSGPRVQETILLNGAVSVACAGGVLAATAISFLRRLPAARVVCLLLLAIHPAWTIGSCCDCGGVQVTASVLDTLLAFCTFAWDAARRR